MKQYLTAVDLREEIAAEKWHQQERDDDEAEKARDESPVMFNGERQQIMVCGAQPREVLPCPAPGTTKCFEFFRYCAT